MPTKWTEWATSWRWRIKLACAIGVACGDDGAKSDEAIDPSFEHWCDQHLCDWQTLQGAIAKTRTWHAQDLAVSFLETPTEITQLLEGEQGISTCLLFDTIADVAPEAQMSVVLDFNDDGVPDVTQQIPVLPWKSVPIVVRTPLAYRGLRVSVVKRGTGRAVLAQMRVAPQANCAAEALTLADGSVCAVDQVCKSGRCEQGRCLPRAGGTARIDASLTPDAGSE